MLFRFTGRIQPFIFLVFPSIFGAILVLLGFVTTNDVSLNSTISVIYWHFASFILLSFIYGIFPLFLKTEKLFRKIGYSKLITEYELVKKFLFVTTPILVIWWLFVFIPSSPIEILSSTSSVDTKDLSIYNDPLVYTDQYILVSNYFGFLANLTIAGFLRVVTQLGKEDFRFYFAKGCCRIISEREDDVEKMKYLILLLDSYNKYIRRNMKVGINGISKIYSIILNKNTEERNQIINLICQSLESDKLSLARSLSSLFKIPEAEFYTEVSFLQKLKQMGVILATAIPIIISVVTLILTTP